MQQSENLWQFSLEPTGLSAVKSSTWPESRKSRTSTSYRTTEAAGMRGGQPMSPNAYWGLKRKRENSPFFIVRRPSTSPDSVTSVNVRKICDWPRFCQQKNLIGGMMKSLAFTHPCLTSSYGGTWSWRWFQKARLHTPGNQSNTLVEGGVRC